MNARKTPPADSFAALGASLRRRAPRPDGGPTILVATDFSEASEAALVAAADLAAHEQCRLVIGHVLTLAPIAHADFVWVPTSRQIGAESASGQLALQEAKRRLATTHPSLKVETRLLSGLLPDAIVDAITQEGADLVVVGSHGRGFWSGLVLGSVARGVSLRARVPVLTVRAGAPDAKGATVLVPIEIGDISDPSLDVATGLAAALGGRLRLLYVFPGDTVEDTDVDPGPARIALEAQLVLGRLAGPERDHAIEVECVTRFGRAAKQIAAEADACKAAFVVLGSHRRSVLQRATHGSVVEDVLVGCRRPIVTCAVAGDPDDDG